MPRKFLNGETLTPALSVTSGGTGATTGDLARANLGTAAPLTPSANLTLAVADFARPVYATATPTITAANGGAGWCSGTIANANTVSGLVTLSVPSGATLDGATNGTTVLKPYQRARIVQTGATAYITDWVDRTPLLTGLSIAAAVSALTLILPVGYGAFELTITNLRVSASTALNAVISTDGGTTFQSGTGYYLNHTLYGQAAGSTGSARDDGTTSDVSISLAGTIATGGSGFNARGVFGPGSATAYPSLVMSAAYFNGTNYIVREAHSFFTGAALANALQILTPSGNMIEGYVALRGLPAP